MKDRTYLTLRVYPFDWLRAYVDHGDDWFQVRLGPIFVGLDW